MLVQRRKAARKHAYALRRCVSTFFVDSRRLTPTPPTPILSVMKQHPPTQSAPRAGWLRLAGLLLLNALLLLALVVVVWLDNSFNRGITYRPAPDPIPWSQGPQVGVNVYNLHLEPDPAVVTRTLELAHAMGARYVRMQVPWEDVEIHGPRDFEDRRNVDTIGVVSAWAKYDRIVNLANDLGLELVLRIDRPPVWAREFYHNQPHFQEGLKLDPNSTGPPANHEDYGRFVGDVVGRYRGQVRYFQLWNEPNLRNEWGWHTPDPAQFAVLLSAGYNAAKEANPDAIILFPSLAPVDGLDMRAPMTELDYLHQVYAGGGGPYFDIMSVQAYGLGQPPDEHRYVRRLPFGETWTWKRFLDTRADVSRIVLLREVMEQHGDADKPIWVSEFGWNSAPDSIPAERRFTWGEPVSEAQKADYLVGHLKRARNEWPWVGVMHVWMFRYGGYRAPDPADPTPYFSLVSRDWEQLPAYHRLQAYTQQPPVAGVGAHFWQHPAVESLDGGWRIRFVGERLHLHGAWPAGLAVRLDGEPLSLHRDSDPYPQHDMLSTPRLPRSDAARVLEVTAPAGETLPALDSFVVERTPPVPLWVWTLLPLLLVGLLMASGAATLPHVFRLTHGLLVRTPPVRLGLRPWLATPGGERALLVGMVAALFVFYKGATTVPPSALGLALFGLLALLRPDLGLLLVVFTVPLFFIPKGLWDEQFGLPAQGIYLPLHEMALLLVAGAAGARWTVQGALVLRQQGRQALAGVRWRALAREYAPHGLFLLAGTIGVVVAPAEGRSEALREWRWLIVEPLLLYGLLRAFLHASTQPPPQPAPFAVRLSTRRVLGWFVAGGALVGLVGLFQFGGLNLAPFFGGKVGFSDDRIFVEGAQRVSSVYGHPNNLGLFMGRIWPLALVVALAALLQRPLAGQQLPRWQGWWFAGCGLLAVGGLVVSFSKGALLAAPVALLVLWYGLRRALVANPTSAEAPATPRRRRLPARFVGFLVGLAIVALPLVIVVLLAQGGLERLNILGDSTTARLKLWASSLAMVRDYPLFGVGLDQFLRVYQDYIHPSLVDTNERFTSHPHNLLLDMWLRLGLLGLVAAGWLVVRFFRRVWQTEQGLLAAGLAAAMGAALVHGLVDNGYFVPDLAVTFWLLLALADTTCDR